MFFTNFFSFLDKIFSFLQLKLRNFKKQISLPHKIQSMLVLKRVSDLQKYLNYLKTKDLQIGFVPTMGALHNGHKSLIEKSKAECNVTVASIFVNPTQFNDVKDLDKYPRTPEQDIEMLTEAGCHVLFMPDESEIYPQGKSASVKFNFGKLDKVLEGTFRPGHFDGMAQVVRRLLDIVKPHRLYMGQKDFQQYTIVASMLEQTKSPIKLVMCETMREKDGLAMSSRNARLSEQGRAVAPLIYKTLHEALEMVGEYSPAEIQKTSINKLRAEPLFKLEYFEIINGRTLLPIHLFEDTDFAVAVVAIWVGDVRLIDNIILKQHIPQEDIEGEESLWDN
jgi:pantoate--beta-alanine ligase